MCFSQSHRYKHAILRDRPRNKNLFSNYFLVRTVHGIRNDHFINGQNERKYPFPLASKIIITPTNISYGLKLNNFKR